MRKVLFVCIENSCRSQMAEGFARALGADFIKAYSAGSKPSGKVNDMAIEVMMEEGIDISAHKSKGFDDLSEKSFDYVITMGCGDSCPFVPSTHRIDWNIENPRGKDKKFFIRVRDDIKTCIEGLIYEIKNEK